MSTSTFSYAQAARGQSAPQQTTAALSSSTTSAPQEKSDATSTTGSQTAAAVATDSAKTFQRSLVLDSQPSPQKMTSDDASPAVSSTLVGTLAESTSNFSLDDFAQPTAPSDKGGRVASIGTVTPSVDDPTQKGARKGKTAKAASKDEEQPGSSEGMDKIKEPVRVELAPAPIPAVNVWSQRMIELSAKSKQSSPTAPTGAAVRTTPRVGNPVPAAVATGGSGTKSKDTKKNGVEAQSIPETASGLSSGNTKAQSRRVIDTGRPTGGEPPRRSGPRGSRTSEKEDKLASVSGSGALPPVQDAMLWPTPESATVADDVKTKAPVEKSDLAADKDVQEDVGGSKPRKKGWRPLPFVPTVNFETPISNVRGSKPKTGGRGGRETSSRGGYTSAVNGSAALSEKSSTVAPSAPGKSTESVEGAKDGSSTAGPARQTPQPSGTSKRVSSDSAHNQTRDVRKSAATALPERPKELSSNEGPAAKAEFMPKGNHATVNGDSGGQHQSAAHSIQQDRRMVSATKSSDHHTLTGKENGQHPAKDHHSQPVRDRAEARGERAVRGGFRGGRGGHSSSSTHGHNVPHAGHSTYQSNGQRVAPNSVYNGTSTVLPPTALPFSPPSQQFPFGNPQRQNARNTSRAHSATLPAGTYGNRLQTGVGNPPRMTSYASHGVPGLPADFQVQQPAPVPAFNSYVDPELLHGLVLQVEYYFSVDNLCKDVFLRRKMNDQGYVSLSVIAKFKRMAELAPSLDFVRIACEQSANLDYIVDQEQKEWIRSRFFWGNFVMPPDEREEDARGPGPDPRTVYFRSAHARVHQQYPPALVSAGYTSVVPPVFSGGTYSTNGNEIPPPHYDGWVPADQSSGLANGTDVSGRLHRGESQLSAAVPDFSPGGADGAPTTLEDYQTYPDEQVDKLSVPVGSDTAGPNGAIHLKTSTPTTEEPYSILRARAFEERKTAKAGETPSSMKDLYRFWTHCLTDKFNVRMYEDFRSLASEDARQDPPADFGLKCLQRYYNSVLFGSSGARPYPAVFKPHHWEAKQLLDSLKPKTNGVSRA